MRDAIIQERLRFAPTYPGIYLMKSASGEVLYVGKATNLRTRLRSYFGSTKNLSPKIRNMVKLVDDFECLVTESDSEALILENTFIKREKPKYNARLKDDKTYPYIKIDLKEAFPQVYLTRRFVEDGSSYFGPYASASSIRKTMHTLKRLFPYRSCTKTITGTDPRPCLEYYIHRCIAPCIGNVTREEYLSVIQQVVDFMKGGTKHVVRDLRKRMVTASDQLDFERAGTLRDQIQAIEHVSQNQKVVSQKLSDEDVIALEQNDGESWVEMFHIRNGKLNGRSHFLMEGTQDEKPSYVLDQFVKQFYDTSPTIPSRVILQHPLEDARTIQSWLSHKRGKSVQLHTPKRGEKYRLIKMVSENASQGLHQQTVKWLSDSKNLSSAMDEIQTALNLPRNPARVECYDISNIQGTNAVGSMVVFEDGRPKKNHYRRFKINYSAGINDYSMMEEMLRRRFKRLSEKTQICLLNGNPNGNNSHHVSSNHTKRSSNDTWEITPDLIIIDGGKGHLSVALQVILDLGLLDVIPIASLAKEKEQLYIPQDPDPIMLPKGSQGLFLVQRIRDEAHRFAIAYHRQRRSKATFVSKIDSIPGIGTKRKRMLIDKFGSIAGVKEAQTTEIASVPGITIRLAEKIKSSL